MTRRETPAAGSPPVSSSVQVAGGLLLAPAKAEPLDECGHDLVAPQPRAPAQAGKKRRPQARLASEDLDPGKQGGIAHQLAERLVGVGGRGGELAGSLASGAGRCWRR